jgi:cytochrome c oxidase subunit 2
MLLAVLLLAGCSNRQNVLHPQSHQERRIAHLWWVMLGAAWFGFGVIVFLLFLGWLRRNRAGLPGGGGDATATALVIVLGVAVPLVVLSLLFVWSDVFVLRSVAAPKASSTKLTVHVIGHQWWWEVRYPGTDAVTANEIHIPTHTRVNVVGTTADVIHSFWVPELNRKVDLIPGRKNRVLLDSDHPGVYRGQCAEFCGLQHAHMAMYVIAEPPAKFKAWLANTAKPARRPATGQERRGLEVFLREPCSGCHQLRGTSAHGDVGPDLTHVQTRMTLAALTIPNRKGYLGGWILDPQHIKPGNKMPGLKLSGPDFQALLAYLETLR